MPHTHDYTFSPSCGVDVCDGCREHKGLARCYCGWNLSAGERLEDDIGEAVWTDGGWEVDY